MITWTESAKDQLERYFARMRGHLQTAGADPSEVAEDVRRHIAEEALARRLDVVTREDVDRILAHLGLPEQPGAESPEKGTQPDPAPKPAAPRKSRHITLLIFGVLLPLLTLGIELATSMCAAAFFDPIPTFWHVLLVAAVPAANLAGWWVLRGARPRWCGWVLAANGFALGVGVFYTLLYLPLVVPGMIALVFFGWGLLPLSPLLSLIAAARLQVLLRRLNLAKPSRFAGTGWGLGASAVALALVALPLPLTRYLSHQAVGDDPAARTRAIQWLRQVGHEQTLLADCYGGTRVSREVPLGAGILGQPVTLEDARSIYYRVTGQPFNAVAPPQKHFATRSWAFLDDFSWDPEQAGTIVGGRVAGLSLAQSRLDALTNPHEAWSYVEWTLEFRNVASADREARAQIALPPGGVVSRLTLWVNGEEREAAFAGNSQVRAAYEQVVKVQRRDPVLVTSCGPDRVFMQCFPVPRNGGTIKVRLGITSPLALESAEETVLRWPHFLERNFSVPQGIEHSVWVESRQPLRSASARLKPDQGKPGVHGLHGQFTESDLSDPRSAVRARRSAEAQQVWVTDPQSGGAQIIRQRIHSHLVERPGRVVFVVDGSRDMTEFFPQVAKALARLPEGVEFALLLARDGVSDFSGPWRKTDAAFNRSVAERLARTPGAGGQDNVPALLRAWDLASESAAGAIVWIHGPQPLLLNDVEALKQRFEWRPAAASNHAPRLYDLQTRPGPNRVLEKLNGIAALHPLARSGTVAEDLEKFFAGWQGESRQFVIERERVAPDVLRLAQSGPEASKHVARLWAFEEVQRLLAARQPEAAAQLAGRYQLVTPVSGAVVLETKEQFERAGLQAVDATTVPVVPEPGVWLLLGLGAVALLFSRIFRRHTCASSSGRGRLPSAG